jgi:hypothetical protein
MEIDGRYITLCGRMHEKGEKILKVWSKNITEMGRSESLGANANILLQKTLRNKA